MAYKYDGPTQLFINNHFVNSISGKTFPTINPATKEVICHVSEADKADVNEAQKAARKAFQTWRNVAPAQRGRYVYKLADLLERDADKFAKVESLDNGKPVKDAKGDLHLVIECFRYYAGWADKLSGHTIPVNGDQFAYTLHEPVGVVGAIIPWNFPLLMLAWKVAPCISAGNTLVLKPAEQTPLTALMFANLVSEAGFPPGVINILPGYGPTAGAAISTHLDIDKIAFTGSVEIGRIVQQAAAASNLKNVTLELGGKSPLIICEDADVKEAVEIAHVGLFLNQGQCCCASSRIFCHEKVYDEFVKLTVEKAKARTVGDPFDDKTTQGPQVDEEQYKKILGYIESGKNEGAHCATGGHAIGEKGYFIAPTVFTDVKEDMKIAQEEIFGPVMSIMKFTDYNDVIKRANRSTFGLAAGVVTKDITRALTLAHNIRAGTVWVNCYDSFHASVPFGGFKTSGIGRELGEYGLRQYVEIKTVNIRLARHKQDIEYLP